MADQVDPSSVDARLDKARSDCPLNAKFVDSIEPQSPSASKTRSNDGNCAVVGDQPLNARISVQIDARFDANRRRDRVRPLARVRICRGDSEFLNHDICLPSAQTALTTSHVAILVARPRITVAMQPPWPRRTSAGQTFLSIPYAAAGLPSARSLVFF
jgi:hypothetical protein